ncbi:MAG: hypothetical protein QM775_10345 [Pirellulales bacterium]
MRPEDYDHLKYYVLDATTPQSLADLNNLMAEGWDPIRETPLGGAGGGAGLTATVGSLILLGQRAAKPKT